MEWIETTGASLDEAKERALDRLGVAEDELEIEVLAEGSRSMLGLRKTEARLRARVRPTSPRARVDLRSRSKDSASKSQGRSGKRSRIQNEKTSNGNQKKQGKNGNSATNETKNGSGGRSRRGGRVGGRGGLGAEQSDGAPKRRLKEGSATENVSSERVNQGKKSTNMVSNEKDRSSRQEKAEVEAMDLETQATITEDFVQGLLDRMGLEARVASTIDETRLTVEAQGLNLGLAIGQRGETVRAITELSRTLIQRKSDGQAEGSLTVDIGGYRARRRSFLADFARSQGEAVLSDGRPRALEPMGAADRKVVHDTIGEIEGLSTISEGSDADRRVVISATMD